ncbi:MAG TPA: AAA family ATPase [bacterium]|nr:AAA family ATPase [bacterium]
MFDRWYGDILKDKINRQYAHILFGARQTGKSTLLKQVLPDTTLFIDLANPYEYTRFLTNHNEFVQICEAMPDANSQKPHFVCVDEAQAVPEIFNAVQYLYDKNKTKWRFVLCGSSARKLRSKGANLLPGRSFLHKLLPLLRIEYAQPQKHIKTDFPLSINWIDNKKKYFPYMDIESRMVWGSLPGIVTADEKDKNDILKAYTIIHLEEEIRREAMIKDWAAFLKFLKLAANESNQILNYAAISRESGISQPTVKAYYQLLEDMFIGAHIQAFTKSKRKNLLSTPRFIFFDLGVRNAAAGLALNKSIIPVNPGYFFEHWVGIELWKRIQYSENAELHYLRTRDGFEIDYIIEMEGRFIPVEVKWTEKPHISDCRHIIKFLEENPKKTDKGYIICRCPRPLQLHKKIVALPWDCF